MTECDKCEHVFESREERENVFGLNETVTLRWRATT